MTSISFSTPYTLSREGGGWIFHRFWSENAGGGKRVFEVRLRYMTLTLGR
jgi:hypothetical protein